MAMTPEEIWAAADILACRGERVTVYGERITLGDRGSYSIICAAVREWRENSSQAVDGARRLAWQWIQPRLDQLLEAGWTRRGEE